jgi:glycosyltransferase involved in cell wall biosynthesis
VTGAIPAVSVVIPNYNYARFLTERFDSILNQSCTDYEIVFLDDASTDESVPLVRSRYGDRLARFEVSDANSGNPFVQWNKGVRLSRGEYVWIAEADDLCTPDFLERMLQAITRSSGIGLAYCMTTPIDAAGAPLDRDSYQRYVSDLHPTRWLRDFTADGPTEVRCFLARKNTITNVSGVLFRREAYLRAGGAPEDLRMCGDWLTYCRVLRESDLAYVSAPLNFHRQHPTKHTQNSVLDLTYFREFLQVQAYLVEAFDLGRADRRAAFRRFLGEWDRLTLSNYGRLGLPSTVELARMARRAYPGAREAAEIGLHLLLNGAKSLAGTWLPG